MNAVLSRRELGLLKVRKWRRLFKPVPLYLSIAVVIVVVLLPSLWIFTSSVTPKYLMFATPPRYWPSEVTAANFRNMVQSLPFGRYFSNSLIFAAGSSLLSVAASFLAAYVLARMQFRGSGWVLLVLVMSAALPQVGTLVPLFKMFHIMGVVNRHLTLIVLQASLMTPFTVWILVAFIRQIPVAIEEAAVIDGARLLQVFGRVLLPLLRPALVIMVIVNFIIAWNELLYPLVFALDSSTKTLTVGLMELSVDPSLGAGRPWDLMSAMSVTMTAPVFALVLVFQQHIISGLTAGAVR